MAVTVEVRAVGMGVFSFFEAEHRVYRSLPIVYHQRHFISLVLSDSPTL